MRRTTIIGLALLAFVGTACGDDDPATAGTGETTDVTTDAELAAGIEAVEFFQSTEPMCAEHAAASGNEVADPGLFATALYDDELSADVGGTVITDGQGTPLLVDVERETITNVDGPEAAMPAPYGFSCPPEIYVGTIDDGGAASGDPCPEWAAWLTDGDDVHLTAMSEMLVTDPASGEISDGLDFLLSDPPTDTAEDQSNYEGAVDSITANLQERFGCTP